MTAPKAKPALRRDTAPYRALERLYDAGGSLPAQSFIDLVTTARNRQYLLRERILLPLIERCLISVTDDTVSMLQPGYAFVRSTRGEEDKPEPAQIVPPRYVPPMREMQPCQIGGSHRAGADDYRKWPSLMGDRRVPHEGAKQGITAAGVWRSGQKREI